VVLWSVPPEGETRGLRAGDIVSMTSGEATGPTLTERTTAVLREVERRGLTVGRLEDYL